MVKKFNRLPENTWLKSIQEVLDKVEKNTKISSQEMIKLGKKLYSNAVTYGSKDWYDWCRLNWGTKRNACSCTQIGNTLLFQTAWSWPRPVMIKLAEICGKNNVEFSGEWADEDCGRNAGWFSFSALLGTNLIGIFMI